MKTRSKHGNESNPNNFKKITIEKYNPTLPICPKLE